MKNNLLKATGKFRAELGFPCMSQDLQDISTCGRTGIINPLDPSWTNAMEKDGLQTISRILHALGVLVLCA